MSDTLYLQPEAVDLEALLAPVTVYPETAARAFQLTDPDLDGIGPDGEPLFGDVVPDDMLDVEDVATGPTTVEPLYVGEPGARGAAGYAERPAPALAAAMAALQRLGAGNNGIIGNASHRYGYHLSRNRLRGIGNGSDYSLLGSRNQGGPSDCACAMDVIMGGWPASRKWLAWLRTQRAAGRFGEISEIIGSVDGKTALYAADSTGWKWTRYTGSGHVSWSHIGIYRKYALDSSFATDITAGWTKTGYVAAKPPAKPPAKPTGKRRSAPDPKVTARFDAVVPDLLTVRHPGDKTPAYLLAQSRKAKWGGRWVPSGSRTNYAAMKATALPVLYRGDGAATGATAAVRYLADLIDTLLPANRRLTSSEKTKFDGRLYDLAMVYKAAHGIGGLPVPGNPLTGIEKSGVWGAASWSLVQGQALVRKN